MKAGDGILIELARQAGVRPPHIFHLYHYRAQMKDRFSIDGYAAFARMEVRHVEAMVAALDAMEAPTKPKRQPGRTRLPDDWSMPEDWLVIGRERRFWPMDVCRTEADKFTNWHRMKGNAYADWKAAWRTWVDGSHRENGTASAAGDAGWTEEKRRAYLDKIR
jgi:hypothetical protein